jgi:hypothetical protein
MLKFKTVKHELVYPIILMRVGYDDFLNRTVLEVVVSQYGIGFLCTQLNLFRKGYLNRFFTVDFFLIHLFD